MIAALFLALLKANLIAGVLILIVAAARKPARRAFGARVAYGLWWLPVLGAAAAFLPARIVRVPEASGVGEPVRFLAGAAPAVAAFDPWSLAMVLWLAGAVASLVWLGFRQARYHAEVRKGTAGPAVVGFIRPKVVTPSDFETRFDAEERAVVLAHEGAHLKRQDARIVALAALVRCLNWFNPLVHLAVHLFRIDQELACDAAVLGKAPGLARVYAETMLKAQMSAHPLPIGCAWPAPSLHPLAERIALIADRRPSRARVLGGAALVALATLSCGALVWAAQPPRLVAVPQRGDQAVSSVPAARQLLAEAVPSNPERETMMQTQKTPAGRLAGAAVVAALGIGTGSPTLAAPDPQLSNSQIPAAAAPAPTFSGNVDMPVRFTARRLEGVAVPPGGETVGTVNFVSARRGEGNSEESKRMTLALNAALGLPADANTSMNCRFGGAIAPGGPPPTLQSCAYSVAGGPSIPMSPEAVKSLQESGVMPPLPPLPPRRE